MRRVKAASDEGLEGTGSVFFDNEDIIGVQDPVANAAYMHGEIKWAGRTIFPWL